MTKPQPTKLCCQAVTIVSSNASDASFLNEQPEDWSTYMQTHCIKSSWGLPGSVAMMPNVFQKILEMAKSACKHLVRRKVQHLLLTFWCALAAELIDWLTSILFGIQQDKLS